MGHPKNLRNQVEIDSKIASQLQAEEQAKSQQARIINPNPHPGNQSYRDC